MKPWDLPTSYLISAADQEAPLIFSALPYGKKRSSICLFLFAAFSDIVMPLALLNFLEIKISAAGIAAFLMLIGYSVDTDILLTTRVLRRKQGTVNSEIFSSFKTGITMTLTSLAAITVALFFIYPYHTALNQIFIILLIGLGFDIMNTWITNTSLIKWFVEKKSAGITI